MGSDRLSWADPLKLSPKPPFSLTSQGAKAAPLGSLLSPAVAASVLGPSCLPVPALVNTPAQWPGLLWGHLSHTESETHALPAGPRQTGSGPGLLSRNVPVAESKAVFNKPWGYVERTHPEASLVGAHWRTRFDDQNNGSSNYNPLTSMGDCSSYKYKYMNKLSA